MDLKPVKNLTDISKRLRQPHEDKSANDVVPVKTVLKSSEQESRSSESLSLASQQEERERAREQCYTGDDEEDDEVVKQSRDESRFLGDDQDSPSPKKRCSESRRQVQEDVQEVRDEKATRRRFTVCDDDDEMVQQSTLEEGDDYDSTNESVSAESGEESFTDASHTVEDVRAARILCKLSRDHRPPTQMLTPTQGKVIPNLEKPHKCIECNEEFSSGKALGGHKGRVHGRGRAKPKGKTVLSRKVHKYSECHQKFSTGQALGIHKANCHPKKRNHNEVILGPTNESQVVTNNVSVREQSSRPLIDLNKTEFDDDNGQEV